MKFKINDCVKVVDGFIPEETGAPVTWHGKITELPSGPDDTYRIEFDAQTLDSLPDDYLKGCIDGGYDEFTYYLAAGDFELAPRRDNDAMLKTAIKNIERRMDELDEDEEGGYNEPRMNQELLDKWLEAFRQSLEFKQIPDEIKDLAADAPDTFARFAFDYEGVDVGKWKSADVKVVCLDWIPRKVSAEAEFFKEFGNGLAAFFSFLEREKRMKGAGALAATAAKLAPEIPKRAGNSQNWGMAKSFMMGASASGYDPTNESDLNAYFQRYNASQIANLSQGTTSQPDPFRKYNGSSLVKVKYPDGIIVKCKFSKVEADLRAGKCSIVKKK
ncbi:MAG: hypothetical protein K9J37_19825 [Saprospiraceae bacterium]|nr:hypothetical protein [Saprospiraceae bacterium]MCF8252176.1 hypothetical protein [Saprospiraceae bacterium]MCF8281571.1 hypothetical protein [Bacteroidales bacterium]MCF8313845.1 hypothetical protein [Saprospiraceae bacterium]MCF8442563.1 hypothetical protein [Saprospiraceae bacterium]